MLRSDIGVQFYAFNRNFFWQFLKHMYKHGFGVDATMADAVDPGIMVWLDEVDPDQIELGEQSLPFGGSEIALTVTREGDQFLWTLPGGERLARYRFLSDRRGLTIYTPPGLREQGCSREAFVVSFTPQRMFVALNQAFHTKPRKMAASEWYFHESTREWKRDEGQFFLDGRQAFYRDGMKHRWYALNTEDRIPCFYHKGEAVAVYHTFKAPQGSQKRPPGPHVIGLKNWIPHSPIWTFETSEDFVQSFQCSVRFLLQHMLTGASGGVDLLSRWERKHLEITQEDDVVGVSSMARIRSTEGPLLDIHATFKNGVLEDRDGQPALVVEWENPDSEHREIKFRLEAHYKMGEPSLQALDTIAYTSKVVVNAPPDKWQRTGVETHYRILNKEGLIHSEEHPAWVMQDAHSAHYSTYTTRAWFKDGRVSKIENRGYIAHVKSLSGRQSYVETYLHQDDDFTPAIIRKEDSVSNEFWRRGVRLDAAPRAALYLWKDRVKYLLEPPPSTQEGHEDVCHAVYSPIVEEYVRFAEGVHWYSHVFGEEVFHTKADRDLSIWSVATKERLYHSPRGYWEWEAILRPRIQDTTPFKLVRKDKVLTLYQGDVLLWQSTLDSPSKEVEKTQAVPAWKGALLVQALEQMVPEKSPPLLKNLVGLGVPLVFHKLTAHDGMAALMSAAFEAKLTSMGQDVLKDTVDTLFTAVGPEMLKALPEG